MHSTEKKEILRFLKKVGVDTRFVSVMPQELLINNLRFSKFSRSREELFKKNYPELNVVRSTIFQKICARSSKVLGESLKPREKVLINQSGNPGDLALSVILEPYSRKYGIEIIEKEFDLENLETLKEDFNVVALPLTLDEEVENVLGRIFNGEKIELESCQKDFQGLKLIYPLLNVPQEWICYWLNREDCSNNEENELAHEFLMYLEGVVPQVRENILKSAHFVVGE
jgi:hypothetical protein